MALFQMKTGPTLTAHHRFPLYSYEDVCEKNQGGLSILSYNFFCLTGYVMIPHSSGISSCPSIGRPKPYRADRDRGRTGTRPALALSPRATS